MVGGAQSTQSDGYRQEMIVAALIGASRKPVQGSSKDSVKLLFTLCPNPLKFGRPVGAVVAAYTSRRFFVGKVVSCKHVRDRIR